MSEKTQPPVDAAELRRMLDKLVAEEVEQHAKRTTPEYQMDLLDKYHRLNDRHRFEGGSLVRWKPGLRNKRRPELGEVAIVLEVLDDPVLDLTEGSGSTYFREPLDLIIGVLDDQGDLLAFHADSRRFELAFE